ncbi:hypothetical protein [Rhodococcus sp. KRD162]|jgi:hypothetical protein|uniref:hypothetical protein n=1 Tax=Rhodococcus sp. KRD162 TaxID=2729725 RepID=UPI0019D01DA6|nr:hypothetical protein [Rhodococcus sp. KRD162]
MRLRKTLTAAAIIPAGIAAIALSGAGAASAIAPVVEGGHYGVQFNAGETAFLGQINAGDAIESVTSRNQFGVQLAPGSRYDNGTGKVYANLDWLVDEAASRGGEVSLSINDPALWRNQFSFAQHW